MTRRNKRKSFPFVLAIRLFVLLVPYYVLGVWKNHQAFIVPLQEHMDSAASSIIMSSSASSSPSVVNSTTDTTNSRRKPNATRTRTRLILHIGPPKTGSTTLQKDLGKLSKTLLADGYIYIGKRRSKEFEKKWTIQNKLLKVSCHSELERFRVLEQQKQQKTSTSTSSTHLLNYTKIRCWQGILDEMEHLREQFPNTHLVLSDEGFSQAPMLESYEKRPAFMEALMQLVNRFEMDLTVVASYRHYEEQLFSAHKMQCMQDLRGIIPRNTKDCWQQPLISKLERWMKNTSEIHLTRPLDKALSMWQKQQEENAALISIQVMDLEGDIHPTVQFVCNILGLDGEITRTRRDDDKAKTKNSCQIARKNHIYTRERAVGNIYWQQEQVAVGIRDTLINNGISNVNQSDIDRSLELFYKKNEGLGCKLADLPWRCPSRDRLDKLLQRSLSLEEQYRPEPNAQNIHIKQFWDSAVDRKMFCDFDASNFRIDFTNVPANETFSPVIWNKVSDRLAEHCNT